MTLAQAPTGPVTVRRVSERLETDDDGLRLVATARLLPGCEATVIDSRDGAVTVKTETGEHLVPRKVADHLHVSRRESSRSAAARGARCRAASRDSAT